MSTAFAERIARIKEDASLLEAASEAQMGQAVLQPLLNLAGWDTGNLRQVISQKPVGGGRVDYSLEVGKSSVFIELKQWNERLWDKEKQLRDYCKAGSPDIAVLTNGKQWRLYLPPVKNKREAELRHFLSLDITRDPETAFEERFTKFLSYDRVRSITPTLKEARSLHAEETAKGAVRGRLTDAWNQLANDNLMQREVLKKFAEEYGIEALDHHLDDFLERNGSLINEVNDSRPSGTGSYIKPASFTFQTGDREVTEPVRHWNELKLRVCTLMYEHHSDDFKSVLLRMRGNWFSESPEHGDQIGDSGVYIKGGGSATIKRLCSNLVTDFGYSQGSLTIEERGGTGNAVS